MNGCEGLSEGLARADDHAVFGLDLVRLSRLAIVRLAAASVRSGRASFDEAFEGLLGDPDPARPDPDGG